MSALCDGECNELELRRVLNYVGSDAEMREEWRRYQLIGALMRDEPAGAVDLSGRIMKALDDEREFVDVIEEDQTDAFAGAVEQPVARKTAGGMPQWLVSGAVAASVTLAVLAGGDGSKSRGKISAIFHFEGLKRIQIEEAHAGDVVGIAGFEDVFIGETLCDSEDRPALPFQPIDPPTIQMEFAVNDGPLVGQDGKLVTARHIWERLVKETRTNVSLKVKQTDDPKVFEVAGRGEMQIAILVEQMRREGYEVLVSRPEVLYRRGESGELLEPIERLFVEIPQTNMGPVMENLANRKAEIVNMSHHNEDITIEAIIPMRGLIGFETDLVNMTRGMGVMSHLFHEYGPDRGEISSRKSGSLISMEDGVATAYSLDTIQQRGRLMIIPGDRVYKGMVVGENAREQDLPVNPTKAKKLTNMRSSGDGKGIMLDAPMKLSLERALEYIGADEYVEATPKNLRLRKKILDEHQRKKAATQRQFKVVEA